MIAQLCCDAKNTASTATKILGVREKCQYVCPWVRVTLTLNENQHSCLAVNDVESVVWKIA